MMPKRIQRLRATGWRMPEGAVYVGRPSKWGNPFRVGEDIPPEYRGFFCGIRGLWRGVRVVDHQYAVDLFCAWSLGFVPYTRADVRRELAGRDLVCWCPLDQPCHADVLLAEANSNVGVW